MGGFQHKNNWIKIWVGRMWGLFIVGGISACGLASPAAPVSPTTSPTVMASPLPLLSPTPIPLHSPSPVPPSSTPGVEASATPTASATLTPVPPHLCSPLGGYTFDELPGIESQPYIPPRVGKDDGHHGVDFAHWQYKDRVSLEGAEVQSVFEGVVAASVADKYPYGNMIIVETRYEQLPANVLSAISLPPGESLYLLYAHLKEPSLWMLGDPVRCGETLGLVGNTGASGNPHLHLETRTGPAGVSFASMEYYKTTSTDEERANYERWRFLGEFVLWDPWVELKNGE